CLGVELTLTVRKHVVNDDGGTKLAQDFELLLSVNNSTSPTHLAGSETGTTFSLVDGDRYNVTEDLTLQPGGDYSQLYTATIPSTDCDSSVTCSPLSARNKICTVTNDDKRLPSDLCQPSSALSVLVTGTNVVAYVPKGHWDGGVTNVAVVNVEGSSIIPQQILTPHVVNACASNSLTGQTVCTANNTDVYVISGTTLTSTLTSAGSGSISFLLPDGACTNCGVAMDATHNKAVIALSLQDGLGGFQYLNLGASPTLEPAFASQGPFNEVSEGILIDPIRNLILSPGESGNFEIVNVATTTSPAFFENIEIPLGPDDVVESAGEDCTTGVALALAHTSTGGPSKVYIADLTQATFTPGSPGTWSAPSQVQPLLESILPGGASGIAVAQGTHTGIVTGESGPATITAIALPITSGSGIPALSDWVTCSIPGG